MIFRMQLSQILLFESYIVLQNILCILCAVLLGGVWGGAPTALFLLAGLIGLPVYSGGSGGIAVWLGPTGGFLPGYLLGAIAAGFIAGRPRIEEKKITFDLVISFKEKDKKGVIDKVKERVEKLYEGYDVQIALDYDYSD